MVIAVENMIASGVSVSVAAGNDGCNACSGSPNAAPNAINGQCHACSFVVVVLYFC